MIPDGELLAAIATVARSLGPLGERMVFVGGATVALLLTDPAARARATKDIDVIANVHSLPEYHRLSDRLRALGFSEDTAEDAPICRWLIKGLQVDVMPVAGEIFGFSCRWFAGALANAVPVVLPDGASVRVITAPYFLATKLDAFRDRGSGDYRESVDLEDVLAIVDGRDGVHQEVMEAVEEIRTFLQAEFARLLAEPAFVEALAGHLPGNSAGQARRDLLLERLKLLAAL